MKPLPKSLEMIERARKRIPGVTQLLSKKPDMFAPNQWPGYFSKAKGTTIWDLDGNHYLDMSISGIGANILGYCDPEVDQAVAEAIHVGSMCSLNAPEEVELAELLCEIHPWASLARFARSGGEAMTIAVRIARAKTRKDKILFCGYHGWHDWYLSANLANESHLDGHLLPGLQPAGVPRGLQGTALPFQYNDINQLSRLFKEHKDQVAAVVMEPLRDCNPLPGFLEEVRSLANANNSLLVFDEITAAFRLNSGGSHLLFGVNPDIAVFAKAMSNGYPMAAIIGTESAMRACEDTFISSTYWTDRIGPVAAIATIKRHSRNKVHEKLIQSGELVQKTWIKLAQRHNLKIHASGIYPLSHFRFEYPNAQAMMTLYVQLMLERGILASSRFYANFAQSTEDLNQYIKAIDEVFQEISRLNQTNQIEKSLKGPIAQSGFKRLTDGVLSSPSPDTHTSVYN